MSTPSTHIERVLRSPDVVDRTRLCRTKLWQLEKAGEFPQRVQLGGRAVGWLESEVTAWLRSRPRAGAGGTPDEAA